MRMKQAALVLSLALFGAREMRAEYVVLKNGQRLMVTSYQLNGDKYQLQMAGGAVEIAAGEVVAIEPEEIFTPLAAKPVVKPPYRELVAAAAEHYKVDAELIASVIAAESNFNPKAVSRKKARGLMQLMPETAARLGVRNIEDPQENIDAGTRYLRDLLQKYNNNLVLALAAYNAGPERIERYGRVPPFAETISYVRRVKRGYENNKSDTLKKKAARAESIAASSLPRTDQAQ